MTDKTIDKGISPDSGERSRQASLAHRRQLCSLRGNGPHKVKTPCKVCHRRACQCAYRAESFPGK